MSLLTTVTLFVCCVALASAGVVQSKERRDHEHRLWPWQAAGSHVASNPVKPGPLKVFILAGQSNMEGPASADQVNSSDPNHGYSNGTLRYIVKDPRTAEEVKAVVNATTGNWTVRDDVWVWFNEGGPDNDGKYGPLTVGFGAEGDPHRLGPELSFGFTMGDALEEQVLIIKTAWGGKTLAGDFRPPSSGGTVGPYYETMMQDVQNVLGNLTKLYPGYDAKAGYEVCGFGWFQGWNDGLSVTMVAEYEKNMVNYLIKDIRTTWKVPNLAVSIPVAGFDGWHNTVQRRIDLIQAQFNAANCSIHPEINNATHPTVTAEETRDFWREPQFSPADRVYHYNLNAETFWLVGRAMGQAMVKMITPSW
eukprot:scpid85578/ scgid15846/ 